MHWDLDGAWEERVLGLPRRDLRDWGPRLRYLAPAAEIDAFGREVIAAAPDAPFVLYGSGDFHHLSGLLVRRASRREPRPLTLVVFDNHPDWDVRPPRWGCGNWVNRALEWPAVGRVSVWGLGNFELRFPARLFANRRALRSGRLEIHPWAERQPPGVRRRFACMSRHDWRDRFARFARGIGGPVYVSVDLDCLRETEAVTNWEGGLFEAADVAWAIARLREAGPLAGGDVCGAWSAPVYRRRFQRLVGWWDHPPLPARSPDEARRVNAAALGVIWPALVAGAGENSYRPHGG